MSNEIEELFLIVEAKNPEAKYILMKSVIVIIKC